MKASDRSPTEQPTGKSRQAARYVLAHRSDVLFFLILGVGVLLNYVYAGDVVGHVVRHVIEVTVRSTAVGVIYAVGFALAVGVFLSLEEFVSERLRRQLQGILGGLALIVLALYEAGIGHQVVGSCAPCALMLAAGGLLSEYLATRRDLLERVGRALVRVVDGDRVDPEMAPCSPGTA